MIKLCELLDISEQEYVDYKVHFAIGARDRKKPYNSFLIDEFKGWQEHQTNKNFSRKYILSLVYYEKDIWMFGYIICLIPLIMELKHMMKHLNL